MTFALLLLSLTLPNFANAQTSNDYPNTNYSETFADYVLEVDMFPVTAFTYVIADDKTEKKYVRYGAPDSMTKEKLASDAAAAKANEKIGIHGVSVILRKPPTKGGAFGQATKKAIEDAGFTLTQTGNKKSHYTVTLPDPVNQEVADKFNEVFETVTPPKEEPEDPKDPDPKDPEESKGTIGLVEVQVVR